MGQIRFRCSSGHHGQTGTAAGVRSDGLSNASSDTIPEYEFVWFVVKLLHANTRDNFFLDKRGKYELVYYYLQKVSNWKPVAKPIGILFLLPDHFLGEGE